MGKCSATTKNGNVCKIPAQDGDLYCHIHKKRYWVRRVAKISFLFTALLVFLGILGDLTGILGFLGIGVINSEQNAEIVEMPYEQQCDSPNVRELIPDDGALRIERIEYVDMNGNGDDEIVVLSRGEETEVDAYNVETYQTNLSILSCDHNLKSWKTSFHNQYTTHPFLSFELIKLSIDGESKSFVIFVEKIEGATSSSIDFKVIGIQDGSFNVLLAKDSLTSGKIILVPRGFAAHSLDRTFRYEWDGSTFVEVSSGFAPIEESIVVRYWWVEDQGIVEQEEINLVIGQTLFLLRDEKRDKSDAEVFKFMGYDPEKFEWVETIGGVSIKALSQGDANIAIYPMGNHELIEIHISIIEDL